MAGNTHRLLIPIILSYAIFPLLMNIRIYGFQIDRKQLPPAMSASHIFSAIEANAGKPVDKNGLVRMSATSADWEFDQKAETWWAGMILRARDTKSFNQLNEENGKLKLTSKQLEGGKIAEICYFIANKTTGSGLLASYHTGPGLPVFSAFASKLFNDARSEFLKIALLSALTAKEKKITNANYRGKLRFTQLVRSEDLKTLLKQLKKVSSMEIQYSAVAANGSRFSRLKASAITEAIKLSFPAGFALEDEIADELISELGANQEMEAKVFGKDERGAKMVVSSDLLRNKMIFAESDYDEMLGDLELSLDDWAPTIQGSKVVKWLLRQTSHAPTRMKITT